MQFSLYFISNFFRKTFFICRYKFLIVTNRCTWPHTLGKQLRLIFYM